MTNLVLEAKDRIFQNLDGSLGWDIISYKQRGGYKNLNKVLKISPEVLISDLKLSELRGRGGAGFPTAIKWEFMPKPSNNKPNYLICNADEGEPGSCKDKDIIRNDPHVLIEGLIVSAHCLRVKTVYVYIRGEYYTEAKRMKESIEQAYQAGILGKKTCDIIIHRGAGSYVCGEETALIESLEGKTGHPRIKPPFPAQFGLYGCPTIVNNVETLAQVGAILTRGIHWWRSLGAIGTYGTKIFSISGDVNEPKNIELPLGMPLKEIIEEYAGGVKGGWTNLQAVIPGGISSGILTAKEANNAVMDFDSLLQFNTSMGTGGIIVISKDTDLTEIILRIMRFFKDESCGQCPPCREGMPWILQELEILLKSPKVENKNKEKLESIISKIKGNTICAFSDGALAPIKSYIDKFDNS